MAENFNRIELDGFEDDLEQTDEVVRIFRGRGDRENILLVDTVRIDQPAILGVLIVDLMRVAAEAFERTKGVGRGEAFTEIMTGFSNEMKSLSEQARSN